jgi:imidazolonepropionase-like amidohydrolase
VALASSTHLRVRRLVPVALLLFGAAVSVPGLPAQRLTLAAAVRQFVTIDTSVVVLVHARIIDGTGAPARTNQTLVLQDGRILAVGGDGAVAMPPGALVLDLTGRSVLPGLVHMHEHLFYGPSGPRAYGFPAESFARLYLAGGVTSMRTAGGLHPYGDIGLARLIDAGERAGPWTDVSMFIQGPGVDLYQLPSVNGPVETERMVNFWADAGATSMKAYVSLRRDEMRALIGAAHKRGIKVTGHICAVTYREAAALGIDNLEHSFAAASDFVENKKPDVCPGGEFNVNARAMHPDSARARALIGDLIRANVAITSTLPIFELMAPGRPMPPGLDVLLPPLRDSVVMRYRRGAGPGAGADRGPSLLKSLMAMEVAFVRAGGTLLVGTDPTGSGGVIPGFANHRAIELLVEAGFTPLEAIKFSTMNGAKFLGREDRIGSIAYGKQADLMIVRGDPSTNIADIRNVELVFKQGVGYDPERLIASVRGRVGLW